MKKIRFILVACFFIQPAFAQDNLLNTSQQSDFSTYVSSFFKREGIATRNAVEYFNNKTDHSNLINPLNYLLRNSGLPLIDNNSEQFYVKPVYQTSFTGGELVGIEVGDGKQKLCLPCASEGGSFVRGMFEITEELPQQLAAATIVNCYNSIKRYNRKIRYSEEMQALIIPAERDGSRGFYIFRNSNTSAFVKLPPTPHSMIGSSIKAYRFQLNIPRIPQGYISYSEVVTDPDRSNFSFKNTVDPSKEYLESTCCSIYDSKVQVAVDELLKETLDIIYADFLKETFNRQSYLNLVAPCKGLGDKFPYGKVIYEQIETFSMTQQSTSSDSTNTVRKD